MSSILSKVESFRDSYKRKEIISNFTNSNLLKSEKLNGGLADGKSYKDIAEKHKVSLDHIKSQVKIGIEIEKEHSSDMMKIIEIVKDHLMENANYYTHLKEMEKDFEKGHKYIRRESDGKGGWNYIYKEQDTKNVKTDNQISKQEYKHSLKVYGIDFVTNHNQEYSGEYFSPFESKGSFKATIKKSDLESIAIQSPKLNFVGLHYGDSIKTICEKLKKVGIDKIEIIKNKFVFEMEPIKETTNNIEKAISDLLEKAWKKQPIGTVSTRKDGKKYKKVSETGNSKVDWKLVTSDKTSKPQESGSNKEKTGDDNNTKLSKDQLVEHAKNTSEQALQSTIKSSPNEEERKIAHEELDRRKKEEAVQEEDAKNKLSSLPKGNIFEDAKSISSVFKKSNKTWSQVIETFEKNRDNGKITEISIDEINITQPNIQSNKAIKMMEDIDKTPIIDVVEFKDGEKAIFDGHHRLMSQWALGKKKIKVNLVKESNEKENEIQNEYVEKFRTLSDEQIKFYLDAPYEKVKEAARIIVDERGLNIVSKEDYIKQFEDYDLSSELDEKQEEYNNKYNLAELKGKTKEQREKILEEEDKLFQEIEELKKKKQKTLMKQESNIENIQN